MARIFREANKRFGPIGAYGPLERNRFVIERFVEEVAKEFFADAARHRAPAQDDALDERDLPGADLRNPFDGDWLEAHERATGQSLRCPPSGPGKPRTNH